MLLRRIIAVTRQYEIQQLARRVGQQVYVADDPAEAIDIAKTVNPDLILFDHLFTPSQIQQFAEAADTNTIAAPIVVVADATQTNHSAEDFKRAGAYEYIADHSDDKMLEQIIRQIKLKADKNNQGRSNKFFADEFAASVSMVGQSKAIRHTLNMIRIVAASNCNPVLIVGETGTGKELATKAVHHLRHPAGQFVAVNCAALTANLLESELFGHVKGSFTSAERDKTGLLELAGDGTILLDEITEMPLELQAKLLRVLQERTFRKVGGIKDIPCKATIIASSNRQLRAEVRDNRFRRDLYYRLNTCPITLAPLRSPERKSDIPLLAEFFLKTSAICPDKAAKITSFTEIALEALNKHDWPGNVRELKNVIDRAILLEKTDRIGLSSIVIDSVESPETGSQPPFFAGLAPGAGVPTHLGETELRIKDFSLAKAERELIARALQETGWQKTRAASLLGITRATLYAKVKQHNISPGVCDQKTTHPWRGHPARVEHACP